MSKIDENLLIDYIHHALSKRDKLRVETLLREDASLRARVSDLRHMQQDVKRGISAEINAQSPSHNMTYASIASTVRAKRPHGRNSRRMQWLSRAVGLVAVFVLGFAFVYSLSDGDRIIQEGGPMVITPTAVFTPTSEPALKSVSPSTIITRTPTPKPILDERTVPIRTTTPEAPQQDGGNFEEPPILEDG